VILPSLGKLDCQVTCITTGCCTLSIRVGVEVRSLSRAVPFAEALPWKPIVSLSAVGLNKVVMTLLSESREAKDAFMEDNV